MKQLFLGDSDGDAFESICQKVFTEYFSSSVERTPLVADGGKDLIIHHPSGLVYVECKHHSNPIGRPVVQKFHSAMITDNIARGIIVSTGGFSKDALEHIAKNHLPIRTVDRAEFDSLAAKAGFIIIYGTVVHGAEFQIEPCSESDFNELVCRHLDEVTTTNPIRPSSFISNLQRRTILAKFYRTQYTIHSELWNNKKDQLLDTIDCSGYFYINAESRRYHFDDEFSDLVSKINPVPMSSTRYSKIIGNPISVSDIEEFLVDAANERYSSQVIYTNNSGQKRTKDHVIRKQDVDIRNTDEIYLPLSSFSYNIGDKAQSVDCVELGKDHMFYVVNTSESCSFCSSALTGPRLMCNDCRSFFCPEHKSMIVDCSQCGKQICKSCAFYYNKSLIFKINLCHNCANDQRKKKLKRYY